MGNSWGPTTTRSRPKCTYILASKGPSSARRGYSREPIYLTDCLPIGKEDTCLKGVGLDVGMGE